MEPTSRLGVVIPVLNEAEHLPLLLEDLLGQDLEPERFVVMILDGGSVDQTEAMAREALATAPFEVLHVANTERTVPYARNLALELLPPDVDLLVELIGHVRIPHDHLRLRLTSWQKAVESHGEGLAAVGVRVNGPDRVASATERWIDGALRSALGSGGGQFARFDRLESTKVPAFATHRRTAVASIGGWDVRWSTSQDSDLSMRLLKAGFVLLRDPSLTVNMARRSTLTSHWRMSVRYGYWRGRLLRHHPSRADPREFAPLFGALLSLLLYLTAPATALWPIIAYAASIGTVGAIASISSRRVGGLFGVPLALCMLHTGFTIGLLRSLIGWAPTSKDR